MFGSVSITTADFINVGNSLYFFSNEMNGLFKICTNSSECVYLSSIPDENFWETNLCAKLLVYEDELIITPYRAKNIWIYSIKNNTWKEIKREKKKTWTSRQEMITSFVYKNKAIMIGSTYQSICVIDLSSDEVKYIDDPYLVERRNINNLRDVLFRVDYVINNDSLYLASCVSNDIIIINLLNLEVKVVEIGDKKNRYGGIGWDGKNLWLYPRKNTNIVKWDGKEKIEEISLPNIFCEDKFYFTQSCFDKGGIQIMTVDGRNNLFINCETGEINLINEGYVYRKILEDNLDIKMDRERKYYLNGKLINMMIDRRYIFDISKEVKCKKTIYYKEDRLCDLEMFLSCI